MSKSASRRDHVVIAVLATSLLAMGCDDGSSADTDKPGASKTASAKEATSAAPRRVANKTPKGFFSGAAPTFVVGTKGTERETRDIERQVALVRGMLFPQSKTVTDATIDPKAGLSAWPKNPIVYGGNNVNSLVHALDLPVKVTAESIQLGDKKFAGPGMRFIGVIPANSGKVPHPEFMLYAGTGPLGVAEINSVAHGPRPWVIADAFGPLASGKWTDDFSPVVDPRGGHRVPWRTVEQKDVWSTATVSFMFVDKLPPAANEAQLIEAGVKGLRHAAEQLEITSPPSMSVYVYPDPRSKQSITTKLGAGHAVPSSHSLHVVQVDAQNHDGFEHLLAHEGTHILTADQWGPAGTPMMGEGVAVWASGFYAGSSLDDLEPKLEPSLTVASLLTSFRKLPEKQTYPFAGLTVRGMIQSVGLEAVRDHVFPAAPSEWAAAMKKAGIESPPPPTGRSGSSQPKAPGF